MKWWSVKKRLPPLERVVLVCFRSGFDGSPIYAFGARLDDSEGWVWGIQVTGYGIHLGEDAGWNNIACDDDYQVTHWQRLPSAPFKAKATGLLRLHTPKPPAITQTEG